MHLKYLNHIESIDEQLKNKQGSIPDLIRALFTNSNIKPLQALY